MSAHPAARSVAFFRSRQVPRLRQPESDFVPNSNFQTEKSRSVQARLPVAPEPSIPADFQHIHGGRLPDTIRARPVRMEADGQLGVLWRRSIATGLCRLTPGSLCGGAADV